MLNTYSRKEIKKTAVLQNAFNIKEKEKLNGVSSLSFNLPLVDVKNEKCGAFNYVRYTDNGNLYRILAKNQSINETAVNEYDCEHVIGTLIDKVVFGTFTLENLTTRETLERVLAKQEVKNWVLGDCEFERRFSYSWSNENLLSMVFSIPNRFEKSYIWEFETRVYPWKLHLRELRETGAPEYYVYEGRNLISSERQTEYRQVVTRLYALGFGEGVNQLNFASINGGKPYIDAPQALIDEYGIIERIWDDRRFEVKENLLERARVLLKSYSKPYEQYEISVADIEKLTKREMDNPRPGKRIRFGTFNSYIIECEKVHDIEGQGVLQVANMPRDLASSISDQADRERTNSLYAQGNTFLYPINFADNADATHPAKMRVYIPTEARTINKAVLTWDIEAFRTYSTGAESSGGSVQSSSSGGGGTSSAGGATTSSSGGGGSATSSSGGGSTQTSSVNGQSTQTSSAAGNAVITSGASSIATSPAGAATGGAKLVKTWVPTDIVGTVASHVHFYSNPFFHTHNIEHTHRVTTSGHTHSVNTPAHEHAVNIPAHTHNVDSPAHSHTIGNHSHTMPAHTHSTTIPAHTHKLIYGIYEGGRAGFISVKVDGVAVPNPQKGMDMAKFFKTDDSGNIQRGSFHTIELIPDSLTRINASLAVQMFIQTEGGGMY